MEFSLIISKYSSASLIVLLLAFFSVTFSVLVLMFVPKSIIYFYTVGISVRIIVKEPKEDNQTTNNNKAHNNAANYKLAIFLTYFLTNIS